MRGEPGGASCSGGRPGGAGGRQRAASAPARGRRRGGQALYAALAAAARRRVGILRRALAGRRRARLGMGGGGGSRDVLRRRRGGSAAGGEGCGGVHGGAERPVAHGRSAGTRMRQRRRCRQRPSLSSTHIGGDTHTQKKTGRCRRRRAAAAARPAGFRRWRRRVVLPRRRRLPAGTLCGGRVGGGGAAAARSEEDRGKEGAVARAAQSPTHDPSGVCSRRAVGFERPGDGSGRRSPNARRRAAASRAMHSGAPCWVSPAGRTGAQVGASGLRAVCLQRRAATCA